MDQLELHKRIDKIVDAGPKADSATSVKEVTGDSFDARHYFFIKADERWLDWFSENGFLDVIKQKSEDPTRYGYRTPEINYLVKVAEKEPAKVTDIMFEVPISAENFNPEVVDRFLYI